MTFADLSPLANHLWQSTLCVAVAWLLTLALRNNRAAVRFWIWMAASAKFLLPFSLFVSVGRHLPWRTAPAIAPSQLSSVMETFTQPFESLATTPLPAGMAAPALNPAPAILLGVWLCGIVVGVVFWVRAWGQTRRLLRAATPLNLRLPVRVMSTAARFEPGIVGIFRPVLLLPAGIAEHLTPAQFEAIIAHELRHAARRDNLTAAIHMLAETIFWFHPLVWWIKWRLIEERERACDESVLRMGSEPQVYAESILKVCEFYLASQAPCAAGVTGGELKKRIEGIMESRLGLGLGFGKRALLATAAFAALALPLALGVIDARAQTRPAASGKVVFDAASVKPAAPPAGNTVLRRMGNSDPGTLDYSNVTLKMLIAAAYGVKEFQVAGPDWLNTAGFDVKARIPAGAPKEQIPLMLQALLADRFKLALTRETKNVSVYALLTGKNGPKLKEVDAETLRKQAEEAAREAAGSPDAAPPLPSPSPEGPDHARTPPAGPNLRVVINHTGARQMIGQTNMPRLANLLSNLLDRPVIDMTSLKGTYQVDMVWRPDERESASMQQLGSGAAPGHGSEAPPRSVDTASAPAATIFTAIQDSLGLRLESRKSNAEILVVRRAEKTPTEN